MAHCFQKRLQMEGFSTLGTGDKKVLPLGGNAARLLSICDSTDEVVLYFRVLAIAMRDMRSVNVVSSSLCPKRAACGPTAATQLNSRVFLLLLLFLFPKQVYLWC